MKGTKMNFVRVSQRFFVLFAAKKDKNTLNVQQITTLGWQYRLCEKMHGSRIPDVKCGAG